MVAAKTIVPEPEWRGISWLAKSLARRVKAAGAAAEEAFMHRLGLVATTLTTLLTLALASVPPARAQDSLPQAPGTKSEGEPKFPTSLGPSRPVDALTPAAPSTPVEGPGESSSEATASEANTAIEQGATPATTPMGQVVPSNRTANAPSSGYDELSDYLIKVPVNVVSVPVTVKDANGRLFDGLTASNFSVYEDGVKQKITFFSSDPFPVSAAIIIDVSMSESAMSKIRDTLGSLAGAFSQFDELSIYTYGNTVRQRQDFLAALGDTTTRTLTRVKQIQGTTDGPAVYNPMTVGPTVNGQVFDPGVQRNPVELAPPKESEPSKVLNDAILRAAMDLGRRKKARRRVIMVLSDGQERGSHANYRDVLRVLLTNDVSVYGVETDVAALPGYQKMSKLRIPGQGYMNILPRYASATGGEVFTGFRRQAVEAAYGNAMEQARSQYTLSYQTAATKSSQYRKIEVRVSGYGTGLKVYARDGYYPVPQQ